jgi:alcohol dehydrogenase (NADP+)
MSELKEIRAIGVTDFDNWLAPEEFTYKPQDLRPEDVEIKIQACGICGSDIHAARGDWGNAYAPFAVGHEIVGIVTATGDKSRFKVGDRVGVGAQCDCCNACTRCKNDHENTCKKQVQTYRSVYPSGDKAQGGYASHVRVNSQFAFKIPDNMETNDVAPLLCGGITGFRPMMTYGVKKGTKVGINGIGGIGHMAILFAKALGAEVTAISRNNNKKDLALNKLGADHYIATNEEDFAQKYEDSLDLIVNTAFTFNEGEMDGVLNLLSPFGQLIFITAPAITEKLVLTPFQMLMSSISVGGSCIGSPKDIEYMLKIASEHNIKPMIETIDINVENVKTAWERMVKNDVKFRFVLTGYDKYFG